MKDNQNFVESQLLHAYLDGELDGVHEEVLFNSLANDAALRGEMQDHLAIRKAIQHDTHAFSPPAAATAAVFSSLGFSIPATLEYGAGMSRLWFSAGSALLAVLSTMLLTLMFSRPGDQMQDVSQAPASQPLVEQTQAVPEPASTAGSAIASEKASSGMEQKTGTPFSPVTVAHSEDYSTGIPVQSLSHPDASMRVRNVGSIPYPQIRFPSAPEGITVYARNNTMWTDPSPQISSDGDAAFRNMSVGLLYALSEYHALGIEAGREAFPQSFYGTLRGADVRYEQYPAVYWATAVYQFTPGKVFPYVYPYFQLQAGSAFNLGVLGRSSLGLAIKPFDGIAMFVGAEGSVLMYKFQDRWFDTKKLGLTYGLRYEF